MTNKIDATFLESGEVLRINDYIIKMINFAVLLSKMRQLSAKKWGISGTMRLSKKRFDLEKAFHQLTMGTVTILSLAILLVLVVLALYSRLQTASEDNSYELLAGVDELQETADDLQDTLDSMILLPNEDEDFSNDLNNIEQRLDEIDETLEIIENNIEEIAPVEDDAMDTDGIPPSTQEIEHIQHSINQMFFVVTYLIGGLSIVTSLVLLIAVKSHARRRHVPARSLRFSRR